MIDIFKKDKEKIYEMLKDESRYNGVVSLH